ncbi:hypothetical protein [Rhodococcus sp. B10]|uniref:hypothetical protein n=1 Tax=Rhodococcus sp. B10 TaxID=2695876 RepID=UPI0014320414|nr:hypothetical protein [Rhodococcus sp. B10]NIL77602.1 hypothetical protein [Rhodococcus sp. B10]
MPGTQRKSAARKTAAKKAAPRTVPATEPAAEPVENPDAFDLLDALGTTEQEPLPVSLFGVHATIRRTYSAEEDLKFSEHLRRNEILQALELVVGDDARALATEIDKLSIEQGVKVVNKIAQLSTLVEGEAVALLPTSARRMAGALATRSSRGSTT